MSSAYLVTRSLVALNGTQTHLPMAGFETMELAQKAVTELKGEADAIQKGQIVVQTPGGAQPLGVTVGQFLQQLGISQIKHSIITVPVKGSILVQPRSSIILPGG